MKVTVIIFDPGPVTVILAMPGVVGVNVSDPESTVAPPVIPAVLDLLEL